MKQRQSTIVSREEGLARRADSSRGRFPNKDWIRTIVVNAAHHRRELESQALEEHSRRWLRPTALLFDVTRIADARCYGIQEGELTADVLVEAIAGVPQAAPSKRVGDKPSMNATDLVMFRQLVVIRHVE